MGDEAAAVGQEDADSSEGGAGRKRARGLMPGWRRRILRQVAIGFALVIVALLLAAQIFHLRGRDAWETAVTLAKVREEPTSLLDFASPRAAEEPNPEVDVSHENFGGLPSLVGLHLAEQQLTTADQIAEWRRKHEALRKLAPAAGEQPVPRSLRPVPFWGREEARRVPVEEWAAFFGKLEAKGEESVPAFESKEQAVREVVRALQGQDPRLLQQWRDGLGRDEARFLPSRLEACLADRNRGRLVAGLRYMHGETIRAAVGGLSLRASLAIAQGDENQWQDSLLLLLRLEELLLNDPLLISQISAASLLPEIMGPIWEAQVASREFPIGPEATEPAFRLDAGQWQAVRQALERIDFVGGLEEAARLEGVLALESIEWIEQSRRLRREARWADIVGPKAGSWLFQGVEAGLMVGGYWDHQRASFYGLHQRYVIQPLALGGVTQALGTQSPLQGEFAESMAEAAPWKRINTIFLRAYPLAVKNAALCEALRRQAIIACYLEADAAQRAESGEGVSPGYPKSLEALEGKVADAAWLQDPIDGERMRYAATGQEAESGYRLWSVGFDGRDDGGRRDTPKEDAGSASLLNMQGDWVWRVR